MFLESEKLRITFYVKVTFYLIFQLSLVSNCLVFNKVRTFQVTFPAVKNYLFLENVVFARKFKVLFYLRITY